MSFNPHIFREYDIRGVADRDLNDALVRDLGRAIGTFHRRAGREHIALGRDCRLSSPRLFEALSDGLIQTGLRVTDIGVGPTPLMYFAVFVLDLDGGVHITGSHNPAPDNGFKMMKGKGSLYGADIQTLKALIETQDFDTGESGSITTVDLTDRYAQHMRDNISLRRTDVGFAVDAGNGAAGPLALKSFKALGLNPVAMLCDMDGTFPVHHPDPTDPKTLAGLTEAVAKDKLELGIAFDGDGDRIGVIDARGDVIWGDRLMIVLSRALLAKHPGAAIIGEVKCSQTMYDDIAKHGGRPIMAKTGHSLIKTRMKEEQALLAGEMSGHIFFADRYYGFDDAIYAALRLIEIIADSDKPLHTLLDDVPQTYATPELRVDCPDEHKFEIVNRVLNHYRQTHDVVDVDGARIAFDDGWGLVRASNTQPVLVMRFESTSPSGLEAIKAEVQSVVTQHTDAVTG